MITEDWPGNTHDFFAILMSLIPAPVITRYSEGLAILYMVSFTSLASKHNCSNAHWNMSFFQVTELGDWFFIIIIIYLKRITLWKLLTNRR